MRASLLLALALAAPAVYAASIPPPGGEAPVVDLPAAVHLESPPPPPSPEPVAWKDGNLLAAVEETAGVGLIPAVVHAARGDRDRAIRAAARSTGAAMANLARHAFDAAGSSRLLLAGQRHHKPCLAEAVTAAVSKSVLSLAAGHLTESRIADLIRKPEIRGQCAVARELPEKMRNRLARCGLAAGAAGAVQALRGPKLIPRPTPAPAPARAGFPVAAAAATAAAGVFSRDSLRLLLSDRTVALTHILGVPVRKYFVDPAKSLWNGLRPRKKAGGALRRRHFLEGGAPADLATGGGAGVADADAVAIAGGNPAVPVFLAVPAVGDAPLPLDLRRTTHLVVVRDGPEDAPAVFVMPVVLEGPASVVQRMAMMDEAGAPSLLFAVRDGGRTELDGASGPAEQQEWLREAVDGLVCNACS